MDGILKHKRTRLRALMHAPEGVGERVVSVVVTYRSKRLDAWSATVGQYVVSSDRCTCPDYGYRRSQWGFGNPCKHMVAFGLLWERAGARPAEDA